MLPTPTITSHTDNMVLIDPNPSITVSGTITDVCTARAEVQDGLSITAGIPVSLAIGDPGNLTWSFAVNLPLDRFVVVTVYGTNGDGEDSDSVSLKRVLGPVPPPAYQPPGVAGSPAT